MADMQELGRIAAVKVAYATKSDVWSGNLTGKRRCKVIKENNCPKYSRIML
jgi:hypothetical protein